MTDKMKEVKWYWWYSTVLIAFVAEVIFLYKISL